jgi:hypothetical protein
MHREALVETKRERYMGLAGRRIVGGGRTTAQGATDEAQPPMLPPVLARPIFSVRTRSETAAKLLRPEREAGSGELLWVGLANT